MLLLWGFVFVCWYDLMSFMDVYGKIDTNSYTIIQHANYDFVYIFGAVGAIVFTIGSFIVPIISTIKIWEYQQ